MAKNKELNLSNLKDLDSKTYNKTAQITLSNDYTLLIDLKFRPSIIEKVFQKLLDINQIVKDNESLANLDLEKYTMLLLITNFTSLKNIEIKSIEEELQMMSLLVDQNIFKEILEKMEEHCAEEIKNFNEAIFDIMQEKMDSLKQQEEFMKVLNEEIEKQKVLEFGESDNENTPTPLLIETNENVDTDIDNIKVNTDSTDEEDTLEVEGIKGNGVEVTS